MSSAIGSTAGAGGSAGTASVPSDVREPAGAPVSLPDAVRDDAFSCCCRACSRKRRSNSSISSPSEVLVVDAPGWSGAFDGVALVLPLVSQITNNMGRATIIMTQDWRDLRITPGGLLRLSTTVGGGCICAGCCFSMLVSNILVRPFKVQAVLSDGEIALVNDLGNNVDTVSEIKINQVGRSVLYFVKGGLFLGR